VTKSHLRVVKEQYEALPYPPRHPADESHRLVQTFFDNLLILNHYCFRGRRDFRSGFRCFVAGGGTGDSVVYLAEQLRFFDAEVVYLDLSGTSRAVAEERARRRGLTNIRWITGSILDVPALGLGKFDYINCYGVLHHLESTEAGLAALNSVLKDDGAMGIMLYGKYARREVYDLQELLRDYLPPDIGIAEKVALGRRLLDNLPESNSFKRNIAFWQEEYSSEGYGDAGFFDLLLHSQDRCFDVREIYELAARQALHVVGFPCRGERYDPCNLVSDPEVRDRLASMPIAEQQALAEKICCTLRKHEFFLTRRTDTVASLENEDSALLLIGSLLGRHRWLAERIRADQPFIYTDDGRSFSIAGNEVTRTLVACMDGDTPIASMCEQAAAAVAGANLDVARQELRNLFRFLNPAGYLYVLECGSHGTKLPDYRRSEYLSPR
jgi:ubiquinone/menaquinone biosynthesis C-methylase UbiE